MWKVSSKIAHTSMLPALGNQDLRLLQDLITADKAVVTSMQKLAVDWERADEALRVWGSGEGDDLGDILNHASQLLNYVTEAFNTYGNHYNSIRTCLKNIRTQEEQLDDLKRRRRTVGSKADAAEKKLMKMNSEHKSRDVQVDLLTQLREQMRSMDHEILIDEARLGDMKRRTTRDMMILRLGGLLEFAEKATIVGELGKLLIEEIPIDQTPPGHPRTPYQGYDKTAALTEEATQCIRKVQFNPPEPTQQVPHNRLSSEMALQNTLHAYDRNSLAAPPTLPPSFTGGSPPYSSQTYPQRPQEPSSISEFGEAPGRPSINSLGSVGSAQGGIRVRDVTDPTGGSFATFPVARRERTNTIPEPSTAPPSSYPQHFQGPSEMSMTSTDSGPPRLESLDFPAPPGSGLDTENLWDLGSSEKKEQKESPVDDVHDPVPRYSFQGPPSPQRQERDAAAIPRIDAPESTKGRHHVTFNVPPTPLSVQSYQHSEDNPNSASPTRDSFQPQPPQHIDDASLDAATIRDANAAAVLDLTRELNALSGTGSLPPTSSSAFSAQSYSAPDAGPAPAPAPGIGLGPSPVGGNRLASPSGSFSNTNRSPGGSSDGGIRTISAGAFRNVGAKPPGAENGSTGPLNLQPKRPLPSSPYPTSRSLGNAEGENGNGASPPSRFGQITSPTQDQPPNPSYSNQADHDPYFMHAPSLPPGAQAPQVPEHMDDPYGGMAPSDSGHGGQEQEIYYTPPAAGPRGETDYMGRPSIGSPVRGDYGMIGNPQVMNSTAEDERDYRQGGTKPDSGYGSGRFATHLDT